MGEKPWDLNVNSSEEEILESSKEIFRVFGSTSETKQLGMQYNLQLLSLKQQKKLLDDQNSFNRETLSQTTKSLDQNRLLVWGTLISLLIGFVMNYLQINSLNKQISLLEKQVYYNEAETRPFLQTRIAVEKTPENAQKLLEMNNISSIPAKVIYYNVQVAPQDGSGKLTVTSNNIGPSGLLVYEKDNSLYVSTKASLPQNLATQFEEGKIHLFLADCVIYGSAATLDDRRWRLEEIWELSKLTRTAISRTETQLSPSEGATCSPSLTDPRVN